MPPLDFGEHLIDILFQIGPVKASGMGTGPIEELDLMAWQFNSAVRLEPWESRMIRVLSREYSDMTYKAREQSCPPPYVVYRPALPERRKEIADAFRAFARSNIKKTR